MTQIIHTELYTAEASESQKKSTEDLHAEDPADIELAMATIRSNEIFPENFWKSWSSACTSK